MMYKPSLFPDNLSVCIAWCWCGRREPFVFVASEVVPINLNVIFHWGAASRILNTWFKMCVVSCTLFVHSSVSLSQCLPFSTPLGTVQLLLEGTNSYSKKTALVCPTGHKVTFFMQRIKPFCFSGLYFPHNKRAKFLCKVLNFYRGA